MTTIYHAHVYFLPEQTVQAATLHATLAPRLPAGCWLGEPLPLKLHTLRGA